MKKSKKILSVVLALVMAFSAFGAAFMASAADKTYTPNYDGISKEQVQSIVSDLNIVIEDKLWEGVLSSALTSDTIVRAIYGLYFDQGALLILVNLLPSGSPKTASWWKTVNAELFAELEQQKDGEGQTINLTKEDINAYLDTHLAVDSQETMVVELKGALRPLLSSENGAKLMVSLVPGLHGLLAKLGFELDPVAFESVVDENGVPLVEVPVVDGPQTGTKTLLPSVAIKNSGFTSPAFGGKGPVVIIPTQYYWTYDYNFTGEGYFPEGSTEVVFEDGTVVVPADIAIENADGSFTYTIQLNDKNEVTTKDGKVLYAVIGGQNQAVKGSTDNKAVTDITVDYVMNLLNNEALRTQTVSVVLKLVRALSLEENRIAINDFIADVVMTAKSILPAMAHGMIDDLIGNYVKTEDSSVEGKKMLDLEGTVNAILAAAGLNGVTLGDINWANLSADMDDADTLMVVYNYAFKTLIQDKNNFDAIVALLEANNIDISAYKDMVQSLDQNALLAFVAPLLHNMVYPEIVDEASGVKVQVNDSISTITPGAAIAYETITSGEAYDKLVEALKAGDVDYEKLFVFDLSLVIDNEEIQPDGTIKVSIPVPEGFDAEKCVIYRLEADGSMTKLDVTVEDGFLVFVTDHLSVYGVAQMKEAVTDTPNPDDDKEQENPGTTDTGDTAIGAVTMIALAAGAAFVLSRKKKA